MTKLGNIETSADTPFGSVDASDPIGSGSRVVVGALMTAVGVGGGVWAYNQLKSLAGTDSFNIPGAGDL
jgi:hypothetical protein